MKYYYITSDFIGGAIAYKLLKEGNEVIISQVQDLKELGNGDDEDPETKKRRLSLYGGVFKKLSMPQMLIQMRQEKDKDDCFVIFDFNHLWKYADIVQKIGFKNGFFPTKKDYEMEMDREGAKELVKKYYPDLTIGTVNEFKKSQDGIDFLNENEGLFVLKGNAEGAQTVCPDTKNEVLAKEELLSHLNNEAASYEKGGFIIEERIIDPIEFTPEGLWYNGELLAVTVDIENKPMGAGNRGKQCGCAQDLVIEVPLDSEIARIAFPPYIHEEAKKRKGLFIFDAGILMKDDKFYFTEFCSQRWGWDAFFTELSMCESVSAYFEAIVQGKNPFKFKYGVATRGFNMDVDDTRHTAGDRKITWLDEVDERVWLYDMKLKNGECLTAGCAWDLVVFTGGGATINSAVTRAYEAEDGFSFSNMIVRPRFDFESIEYKSSIMNRYNQSKHLF
jgi:hypothetical protein